MLSVKQITVEMVLSIMVFSNVMMGTTYPMMDVPIAHLIAGMAF
jgi:hypothetical protein